MKTKEFIRKVKELGFIAEKGGHYINIYEKPSSIKDSMGSKLVADVNERWAFTLNIYDRNFEELSYEKREKLFNLLVEYARTPVEEREEPKKYCLRHRWMGSCRANYLNFYVGVRQYSIDSKISSPGFKTEFTQAEIEKIKEKFNTDLEDFEIIEVEESKKDWRH